MMDRAPLTAPHSPMQSLVCDFLGLGMTYAELAEELHISPDMVREHTKRAAAKIPGDLPAQMRCIAWARGASLDVLRGMSLRAEVNEKARGINGRRGPTARETVAVIESIPTVGMLR